VVLSALLSLSPSLSDIVEVSIVVGIKWVTVFLCKWRWNLTLGVTLSEPSVQYHRTWLSQQCQRPAYFRRLQTNHFTGYITALLEAVILPWHHGICRLYRYYELKRTFSCLHLKGLGREACLVNALFGVISFQQRWVSRHRKMIFILGCNSCFLLLMSVEMLVQLQCVYSIKIRMTWWLRLVEPCSPVIIFMFVLGLG
jgi:hypothetical protein